MKKTNCIVEELIYVIYEGFTRVQDFSLCRIVLIYLVEKNLQGSIP